MVNLINKIKQNKTEAAQKKQIQTILNEGFDPVFYLNHYPDLKINGVDTHEKAILHFIKYGKNEGRKFSATNMVEVNSSESCTEKPSEIAKNDKESTYDLLLHQAKDQDIQGDNDSAILLYKKCITIKKEANVLELLGNCYLKNEQYHKAVPCYEAVISENKGSDWVLGNYITANENIGSYKYLINSLVSFFKNSPDKTIYAEKIIIAIEKYWEKQQDQFNTLAEIDEREKLKKDVNETCKFIFDCFFSIYKGDSSSYTSGKEAKTILIIADLFLPQCERYRVNQKKEQLEAENFIVNIVSWTNIDKNFNRVVLSDLIIIYRAPAFPSVVRAIAQAKAVGKPVIYEIDDLIFDSLYPGPLKSYSQSVTEENYYDLIKGMAYYNTMGQLCEFGLVSTTSLKKEYQRSFPNKPVWVHRNGLDSLNSFQDEKTINRCIKIFYGSGTLAHNADFIEIVIPALDKILEQYSAEFVCAGYLDLPKWFIEKHAKKVRKIDMVRSIKGYWQYLKASDINLAVLKADRINNTKSELKWFEAGCFSIPSVVSDTENYLEVVKNNEDGLIASNSTEWYEQLKRLIEDKKLYNTISNNIYARVKQDYTIKSLSKNIKDIVTEVNSKSIS